MSRQCIVVGTVLCAVVLVFLTSASARQGQLKRVYYTEHSRKFTSAGSSERRLLADATPSKSSRILRVPQSSTLKSFLAHYAPVSRELILGVEGRRVRKAYATRHNGDILSIEDATRPRMFVYTQTDDVDMSRYFRLSKGLTHLNRRWGHVRTDETGRVDAAYVSIFSERVPVADLKHTVQEYIGRDWTSSEMEWWSDSAASIVTFVGVGSDHITLYYGMHRHDVFPSDEVKNHVVL